MSPALTPFATLKILVSAPVSVEPGRRFIPIIGGTVEGAYPGEVVPGGGDWQTIHADGRMEIDAHYVLNLSGALVEVRSVGLRHGPPDVLARLAKGEAVDPSLYYFRTSVRLTTGAPQLGHLNARLFISTGARMADHVRLEVFELG